MKNDYKSEKVFCEYESDTTHYECEALIGKQIAEIEAREKSFKITFRDKSSIEFSNSNFDRYALSVDFSTVSE